MLINDALIYEKWWKVYEKHINSVNCTLSDMMTVLNRALVVSSYPFAKACNTLLGMHVIIIIYSQ